MEEFNSIADLKGMVRRRKKCFTLTFSTILVAAVVVVFLLRPIYLSQSTILIENQQIPQDCVKERWNSMYESFHALKEKPFNRTPDPGSDSDDFQSTIPETSSASDYPYRTA